MKWRANPDFLTPRHFEIKHDPLAGFYLYVYDGERCVRDDLQDSLEIAIECALEDYNVPKDAWIKVEQ